MPLNSDQLVIFNDVCNAIVCGDSVYSAVQAAGIADRTFYLWLSKYPEHRPVYIEACRVRGLCLAELVVHVIKILPDCKTNEEISARREQANLARWYAGRMQHKMYGDKIQVDDAKPEAVEPLDNEAMMAKVKEFLDGLGLTVVAKADLPAPADKPS